MNRKLFNRKTINLDEESNDPKNKKQYEQNLQRDRNKIRWPDRLTYTNIVITGQYEPESYDDAIKWKGVMDDEIDSLRKTQTWTLINPSSDHQIIYRWTYWKWLTENE